MRSEPNYVISHPIFAVGILFVLPLFVGRHLKFKHLLSFLTSQDFNGHLGGGGVEKLTLYWYNN